MLSKRANSSIIAVLVILLVIAGVIYLFWQSTSTEPTENPSVPVEIEEPIDTTDTEATETEIIQEDTVSTAEDVTVTTGEETTEVITEETVTE